jgi:hypothetical protein
MPANPYAPAIAGAYDMVTTAMLELDQEHAGELGRAGDRR